MITGNRKITWKKVKVLFLKKNFYLFCFSFKKMTNFWVRWLSKTNVKKAKKLNCLKRIFHLFHYILGILDSFRYPGSSEPVKSHFFVSLHMVKHIYNPFGMQGFYHQKEKRNLYVKWCYGFFELFWNFICHRSLI